MKQKLLLRKVEDACGRQEEWHEIKEVQKTSQRKWFTYKQQ